MIDDHIRVTQLSRKRSAHYGALKFCRALACNGWAGLQKQMREATRALRSVNDFKSDSQVDNGSGWCLLCLRMERLHVFMIVGGNSNEKKVLHNKILSRCFLNAAIKIQCSVPWNHKSRLYFGYSLCSVAPFHLSIVLQSLNKGRNWPTTMWAVRW